MRRPFCLVFAPLLCWACQTATPIGPALNPPPPPQESPQESPTNNSAALVVGEQLEIIVKTAPELSRTVTVAPDGTIRIPYTGPIQIAGRRLSEVEQDLRGALASELRDPDVRVMRVTPPANRCQPCGPE